MILTTQNLALTKYYDAEEAIRMTAAAGFDALDCSLVEERIHSAFDDMSEKKALSMKKCADDCGIRFRQAHAPFPSYRQEKEFENYNVDVRRKIERSIEFSALLGVKVICIHPAIFLHDEEREFSFNLEFYNSFVPLLKETGIKIGVENMFWHDRQADALRPSACGTPARMIRLYDALDPTYFTCLLDIGHCGLVGEDPARFIRTLGGKRLGALHVHDNDFHTDQHTLPFTRSINWSSVTDALREIGYAGDFTYEDDAFLTKFSVALYPDALRFMHAVGRQLISMIENGTDSAK